MSAAVAIVGGGMVGASLAVALAPLGVRVALIEAVPHDSAAQPSFDERTTALSNGSRRILETLGLWPAIAPLATPIRKIHISDQGRFGFARLDAKEQGLGAMGFVVPNRALGDALWARLQGAKNVEINCPATVRDVTAQMRSVTLRVSQQQQSQQTQQPPPGSAPAADDLAAERLVALEAQLVVAADGAQSLLRGAFGVAAQVRDYEQTAVITTVLPQRFHDNVAYERFTPDGPLALLPLAGGRCTLVLTLSKDAAAAALTGSDEQFLAEVQRRFGFRLGRFLKVGRRVPYPLYLTRAAQTSAGRCVIIGNAAQGLHPIAGMGFNLGLRDVASLAELIAERVASADPDLGSPALLAEYDAWRATDRSGVIAFTDGLVRLFASPMHSVRILRNLGLLAFDLLPPAKAALSRLSSGGGGGGGGGGRIPKLARGVPLQ